MGRGRNKLYLVEEAGKLVGPLEFTFAMNIVDNTGPHNKQLGGRGSHQSGAYSSKCFVSFGYKRILSSLPSASLAVSRAMTESDISLSIKKLIKLLIKTLGSLSTRIESGRSSAGMTECRAEGSCWSIRHAEPHAARKSVKFCHWFFCSCVDASKYESILTKLLEANLEGHRLVTNGHG